MKIFQHAELSADPILPMDAVTKQYVDQLVITAGQAVGGGVFFTNISPTGSGIVGSKEYVPGTIPANTVITDGTTDTANVRVTIIAEGSGSFYSPTVTISSVPPLPNTPAVVTLTENATDKRFFNGVIDLTGVSSGDYLITATSSTGAIATTTIHRAVAGPNVSSVTIGSLPGAQTEAKAGDVIQISGVVPNASTYVEIIAGGASGAISSQTLGAADSASPGFRTFAGTFVASNATGTQTVNARARNALGTFGSNTVSTNNVTMNQTYPAIAARVIAYPASQSAIKGVESATVTAAITNADTVAYTSSGDLTVTAPSTYAAAKTVTRQSGGYVVGTNNYTITATKTSNGAVTTGVAAIAIADTAPSASIAITGSPARLQSTAAGNNYTVRLTPNQTLLSAPTLVASSGTWTGAWTNSAGVWSRTLQIKDSNPKGAQTFNTLQATGLAGVVGSVITAGSAYTIGGFPSRTITFPAFARFAPIGTDVGDITKVTALYTGAAALTRYNDIADHFQGFTIVNALGEYDANGGYLYISDGAFAGSNTTGTLQLDVTEAA